MINKKRAATLAATVATTLFLFPSSQAHETGGFHMHGLYEHLEQIITPSAGKGLAKEEAQQLWLGRDFTPQEARVLEFLQERGITDRAALATILGNIRQESLFETRICEGGTRTGYSGCHRGGFGLIQWTTHGRYHGLGTFSNNHGLDPNTLEAQLRWMVNEGEWLAVDHIFKTPGKSIDTYMNAAYRWLGWGIHGSRTTYAHQYYQALYQA